MQVRTYLRKEINNKEVGKMSKMCPLTGCKEKQGMCTHEKMMVVIVVVVVLFGIAKLIGLF